MSIQTYKSAIKFNGRIREECLVSRRKNYLRIPQFAENNVQFTYKNGDVLGCIFHPGLYRSTSHRDDKRDRNRARKRGGQPKLRSRTNRTECRFGRHPEVEYKALEEIFRSAQETNKREAESAKAPALFEYEKYKDGITRPRAFGRDLDQDYPGKLVGRVWSPIYKDLFKMDVDVLPTPYINGKRFGTLCSTFGAVCAYHGALSVPIPHPHWRGTGEWIHVKLPAIEPGADNTQHTLRRGYILGPHVDEFNKSLRAEAYTKEASELCDLDVQLNARTAATRLTSEEAHIPRRKKKSGKRT